MRTVIFALMLLSGATGWALGHPGSDHWIFFTGGLSAFLGVILSFELEKYQT